MILSPRRLLRILLVLSAWSANAEEKADRAGRDWWSFQPVQRGTLPGLTPERGRGANAIDAFVLAAQRSRGLSLSPPAASHSLIRRVSFDLVGLPPSEEEIRTWEADASANAYGRMVDRYLASPHYGERWARHWLDVARFGESQGFERDKLRTHAWRYRDWVVESCNSDLPYNVFARQQLAGDVLDPRSDAARIATGFLVAGAYDEVGQSQQSAAMKAIVRQEEIEDYVSTVSQAFLGLTVHCARCHDHKFDPISQKEYFQLAAAFAGVRHGERELAETHSAGPEAALRAQMESLLPTSAETGAARAAERAHLESQRERWKARRIYAVAPQEPEPVHLLNRGNPGEPRERVAPGGVAAVRGIAAHFGLPADAPEGARRIKATEWITHENNPLFARVVVNRLWHYHFGRGLVENPSDFGFHGGMPSHPGLLDWLAAEMRQRDWSRKAVHRLILNSATYRQSSLLRRAAAERDADNRFLWRMPPRRLEAEALRDAILRVAGQLNPTVGGPGYYDFTTFVNNTQFYTTIDPVGYSFNRRSLYRTWVRSGRNGFLDAFDCPDPSATAPKRAVTTTPLQSLALLNNSFVLRMAEHFAERVGRLAGADPHARIRRAFRLAYGRAPDGPEIDQSERLTKTHGLRALCRVLINSNEFLHVD